MPPLSLSRTNGTLQSLVPLVPTDVQQHSLLMRLPFEVRRSILQLLLVTPAPLFERSDHIVTRIDPPWFRKHRHSTHRIRRRESWKEHSGVTRHGFNIHPQLLRACQQLWREGWLVLYKENVLGIDIHATDIQSRGISQTGGTQAWIPAYQAGPVLEPRKNKNVWYDGQYGKDYSPPESYCKRFRAYHIRLGIGPVTAFAYDDLRDIVLRLKSALSTCCVTVELSHYHDRTAGRIVQHVKLFQLLRAQAFRVDYKGTLREVRRELPKISDNVTSNSKVCDLLQHLDAMKEDPAMRKFMYSDDMKERAWCSTKLATLKISARDFDKESFERIKDELAAGLADDYATRADDLRKEKEKQLLQLRKDYFSAKLTLGRM